MKANNNIINISLSICKILFILLIIATVIETIRFITGLFIPDLLSNNFKLVVPFKAPNIPITLKSGQIVEIAVNSISASLKTKGVLSSMPYISGLLTLLKFAMVTYFFYVAKVLITGVKNNNPFSIKLFSKLKIAAIISLFIGLMYCFKDLFILFYIKNNVQFPELSDISNAYVAGVITGNATRFLILPLVILVIAEFLRQGAILKEEQESFI